MSAPLRLVVEQPALRVLERLNAAASEDLAAQVARWLRVAGHVGDPIELQALKVPDGRYEASYFAHASDAAMVTRLAAEMEKRRPQGTYYLLNRIDPAIATRAKSGHWHAAKKNESTTDSDVIARMVAFVDVDFQRPRGTSSTDAQTRAALEVAAQIYQRLADLLGEMEPDDRSLALGMSGNAGAVFVALDALPNTPEVEKLIKGLLVALGCAYGSDTIKIDASVSDAKRLGPLWGTTKRKGASDIEERPHRRTYLTCSDEVRRLSVDEVTALVMGLRADLAPNHQAEVDKALGVKPAAPGPEKKREQERSDDDPWKRANECEIRRVAARLGLLDGDQPKCPGCGLTGDSSVAFVGNGIKCMHNRCASNAQHGFYNAVDAVAQAKGLKPIEAVRLLGEWFGFELPKQCGAPTRSGKVCASTELLGNGRCRFHQSTAQQDDPKKQQERETETTAPPESLTLPIAAFLGDEADADTPEDFLTTPLLPAGVVAFVPGEPTVGKTYIGIHWALCVAAGRKLFGKFECKQGPAVIVCEEDTEKQVRRRLWWLSRGLGLDPRTLPVRVSAMKLFRLDEEPKRLRLEQEAKGAALVVIDCLTRVHGLDENSRTDMQIVTRALTAIAVQTGATVLVLHHFRKAGIGDSERRAGQMMRGTGDLHALARAVIGVKRPKKGNELHLEPENNYASPDELEPFAVRFTIEPDANGKKAARFEYVGSSEDADASALDEKVMEVLKGSDTPMVGAAIRAAVGGNGTAVDAAVKRLAQTDRIELVKFDREDAAGRKRHLEGWRVCRR